MVIADYYSTPPEMFFLEAQASVVDENNTPLQRIVSQGQWVLMTQDGDLFDEDVAQLTPPTPTITGESYGFAQSNYLLTTKVYVDHKTDFYGDCNFKVVNNTWAVSWKSCGYKPLHNVKRAKRIEWEAIVPLSVIGDQLQCWQHGGRAHCRDISPMFRQMEADMHNLFPVVGELHADRHNFRYQMIANEARNYGKVNVEIDFGQRVIEIPPAARGDAARASLYMRDRYGLQLGEEQAQLMIKWNNADPVDAWEKRRNRRITELQGNDNPYISQYRRLTPDDLNHPLPPLRPALEPSQRNSALDSATAANYRAHLPGIAVAIFTFGYAIYAFVRRTRQRNTSSARDSRPF